MIAEPMEVGGVHWIAIAVCSVAPDVVSTAARVGASGASGSTATAVVSVAIGPHAPQPSAFLARTRTRYDVLAGRLSSCLYVSRPTDAVVLGPLPPPASSCSQPTSYSAIAPSSRPYRASGALHSNQSVEISEKSP